MPEKHVPLENPAALLLSVENSYERGLSKALGEAGVAVANARSLDHWGDNNVEPHVPNVVFVQCDTHDVSHLQSITSRFASARVIALSVRYSYSWAAGTVRAGCYCALQIPFSAVEAVVLAFDGLLAPMGELQNRHIAWLPTIAKVEWEYINRVLVICDGNISKAAKALGIARQSLQRKLRKYGPVK